jgi:hypothetical protein
MEQIDIMFNPNDTAKQKLNFLESEIERIESMGLRIVGTEPIEQINVEILGRRFIVE